jgi:hypothetical protein
LEEINGDLPEADFGTISGPSFRWSLFNSRNTKGAALLFG